MKREELVDNIAKRLRDHFRDRQYREIEWDDLSDLARRIYRDTASDILDLMPFDEIRGLALRVKKMCDETCAGCMTVDKILSLLPEPDEPVTKFICPDCIHYEVCKIHPAVTDIANMSKCDSFIETQPEPKDDGLVTFKFKLPYRIDGQFLEVGDLSVEIVKGKPDEPKADVPYEVVANMMIEESRKPWTETSVVALAKRIVNYMESGKPKADVRKRLNDAMSDLVLEISVDMHKGKSKKMCEYTDRILEAIGGDSDA